MRRLTAEIKRTSTRVETLTRLDQATCSVWGKKFNENKVESLKAFLVVAREAELKADKVVFLNKNRRY